MLNYDEVYALDVLADYTKYDQFNVTVDDILLHAFIRSLLTTHSDFLTKNNIFAYNSNADQWAPKQLLNHAGNILDYQYGDISAVVFSDDKYAIRKIFDCYTADSNYRYENNGTVKSHNGYYIKSISGDIRAASTRFPAFYFLNHQLSNVCKVLNTAIENIQKVVSKYTYRIQRDAHIVSRYKYPPLGSNAAYIANIDNLYLGDNRLNYSIIDCNPHFATRSVIARCKTADAAIVILKGLHGDNIDVYGFQQYMEYSDLRSSLFDMIGEYKKMGPIYLYQPPSYDAISCRIYEQEDAQTGVVVTVII